MKDEGPASMRERVLSEARANADRLGYGPVRRAVNKARTGYEDGIARPPTERIQFDAMIAAEGDKGGEK